ncbi:MAG: transglycosylase SLT domain-containing protein [Syntrophobacterales bacterium]|nr:MAG: transglycosylase SLT domain-containing protein [Syntrophobacterales bacterium]
MIGQLFNHKTLPISLILLTLLSLATSTVSASDFPPVTSNRWTNKYDRYFRKYTKRFFGAGFEWKWFKAQAIAESNLNNEARSWVNAKGIMQIMPKTFHEIKKKNPSFVDIDEPRWNIAAGIYYDHQLYQKWKAKRPLKDRIFFTFGSYNAGFRTIVRAQRVCKKAGLNENIWRSIKSVAPEVRGWRHRETLGYVDKIREMMTPIID